MGGNASICCGHTADRVEYKEPEEALPQGRDGTEVDEAPNSPADDELERQRLSQMKEQGGKRRKGVAAESVDNDKVKNYVKPVFPKDDAANAAICKTLKENEKMKVLFGHLDKHGLDDVVNAFDTRTVSKGESIIKQGAEGDFLYIISEGEVDVHVARPGADGKLPSDKGPKVATLRAGALFGELALMYSAPRAATIIVSSTTAKLWQLDREAFKMLLAGNAITTLQQYEGWLSEVEILKSLNHFELARLADALDSTLYDAGEVVIQQGDPGDKFYILEEGTCAAYISGAGGEKEVKKYEKQGDFFGEIALLTDQPRKATVKATGEGATVAFITKEDFTAVLGPLKDRLMGQLDKYPQYADVLTT